MKYLIYHHISIDKFLAYKIILNKIEPYLIDLLVKEKFYPNRGAEDADALAINFNTSKDGFLGNISLIFNDNVLSPSFDLGVIKTFDINSERKFKRKIINSGIRIEDVEKNYKQYFIEVVKIYNSISKAELTDS